MVRLGEPAKSGVVLLDAGVVRDVAAALSGLWTPDDEFDAERRERLIAAGRVRLYADRDRHGWALATTPSTRSKTLARSDEEWAIEFIADVSTLDDVPPLADILALDAVFHEAGIQVESSDCLAYAVLYEPVVFMLTNHERAFEHRRVGDLPARLQLITPMEAVEHLSLPPGEEPMIGPPLGTLLYDGPHWWVP